MEGSEVVSVFVFVFVFVVVLTRQWQQIQYAQYLDWVGERWPFLGYILTWRLDQSPPH